MIRLFPAILLLQAGVAAADSLGRIQPDPSTPCRVAFKPHEMCFETPKDEIARDEYLSEPFYAVMLLTAERCTIPEATRLQAQQQFPRAKVFSMRFHCEDDIEENISYTNVNDQFGFLAVYAGRTLKEAKAMLEKVKATGRFQGANIRRMQARLMYP